MNYLDRPDVEYLCNSCKEICDELVEDCFCPSCGSDSIFEREILYCDDCEAPTAWKHAVQLDPWFKPTGDVYCENCAEKRWDRQQERLMEGT